jgi:hypothetical protein
MQAELRAALDALRRGETRPRPGPQRTWLGRHQDRGDDHGDGDGRSSSW